jgi:6-phosphogluconolactonase
MSVAIEVVEDPARSCAAMMVGAAAGAGQIVLAGGSTPKAAYEHFVAAVSAVGLDLSQTTFWIGDERCVEPDDDECNYKMIRQSLLDALPGAAPAIHRIEGELGPDAGAEEYEQRLHEAGDPHFDLMLLGIGPDGHTLSLFPGQSTLAELSRLVVGVPQAGHEPFVPRVSMTLAAVGLAQRAVLLASGESKADAILEAFGPDAEPVASIPSSMLAGHSRELTVLIDPAAASKLPDGGSRA